MEVTVTAEDSTGATATAVRAWRVRANRPPAIAFTTEASLVDGHSITTISGNVEDVEDDDGSITVTATSTLGTVSAVTHVAGAWSFTLTAPAVTDVQQHMNVAVTAEDASGGTSIARQSWAVRANRPPTVSIINETGTVDSDTVIALDSHSSRAGTRPAPHHRLVGHRWNHQPPRRPHRPLDRTRARVGYDLHDHSHRDRRPGRSSRLESRHHCPPRPRAANRCHHHPAPNGCRRHCQSHSS